MYRLDASAAAGLLLAFESLWVEFPAACGGVFYWASLFRAK
jgi:hypothetical protein